MATVVEIHRDTFTGVDNEPIACSVLLLRDAAHVSATSTENTNAVIRDSAELNDGYTETSYPVVRDSAILDDTPAPSVHITRVLHEGVTGRDDASPSVRITKTVRDSAVLDDATLANPTYTAHDSAVLDDAALPSHKMRRILRDTAVLGDAPLPPLDRTVRDSAVLDDGYSIRLVARHVVRDEAVAVSDASVEIEANGVLHDAAGASDGYVIKVTHRPVLHERGYVEGEATPPPYGRAYTCSVKSWGMSTFSNYPFLTKAGRYAAGQNLWRTDATTDYGTPIVPSWTTGILELGTDRLKILSGIFVDGSSDKPITVQVTADVDGIRATYSYTTELRNVVTYRSNRAVVGKGFRSRHIQVRFVGTGANFRILGASADMAISARRL